MVVWDIVKNSEKKIILRSMRSGEILCKYGAKEKIPKEMRENLFSLGNIFCVCA